jgi:RNA polymerase sigma factor (sigma-70 family)
MRPDTFDRLFDDHAEALFAFLVYRTGNRSVAEDLLGDTFERVLRTRHRFDPRRGSEKQWIYTIALNLVRDHARRHTVESRAMERIASGAPHAAEDSRLDAIATREELHAALDTLGDNEREAIALRFGSDLTVRDVARVLGEKENAVEGRIYRGLQKLRSQLE